jgi:hypothetical protein
MTMRQRKHRAAVKDRLPEEWKRIYRLLNRQNRRALESIERLW